MPYTVKARAVANHITAETAAQALRKAKALAALGHTVKIVDPGKPMSVAMLELAVREKRIA
jgi:hypothetical protein